MLALRVTHQKVNNELGPYSVKNGLSKRKQLPSRAYLKQRREETRSKILRVSPFDEFGTALRDQASTSSCLVASAEASPSKTPLSTFWRTFFSIPGYWLCTLFGWFYDSMDWSPASEQLCPAPRHRGIGRLVHCPQVGWELSSPVRFLVCRVVNDFQFMPRISC